MDPNYPRRQLCKVPMGPNIPGVITHTTYTFWIFTLSKMGHQTGRIGVRISTMWNTIEMCSESQMSKVTFKYANTFFLQNRYFEELQLCTLFRTFHEI